MIHCGGLTSPMAKNRATKSLYKYTPEHETKVKEHPRTTELIQDYIPNKLDEKERIIFKIPRNRSPNKSKETNPVP